MAQIVCNPGCEPDNPNRPKTEIIPYIPRERIIAVLTELREALEALGPPAVFSIAHQDNGNAAETVRGIRRSRGGHPPSTAR